MKKKARKVKISKKKNRKICSQKTNLIYGLKGDGGPRKKGGRPKGDISWRRTTREMVTAAVPVRSRLAKCQTDHPAVLAACRESRRRYWGEKSRPVRARADKKWTTRKKVAVTAARVGQKKMR